MGYTSFFRKAGSARFAGVACFIWSARLAGVACFTWSARLAGAARFAGQTKKPAYIKAGTTFWINNA